MTRKSKREIERAVDDLDAGENADAEEYGPRVVYEKDGEYFAEDGDPAPTDEDGSLLPSRTGVRVILDGEYASPDGADWGEQ